MNSTEQAAVAFFISFFLFIFGMVYFIDTNKQECRVKAMEKSYTADQIQSICKS